MAATLGSIGEELNLLIRQGATLGPMLFTMTDGAGARINLTGSTLQGRIRKVASGALVRNLTFTITNPTQGEFQMGLTATETAALPPADPKFAANRCVWEAEMVDAAGRVIPLYYGTATVFKEVS